MGFDNECILNIQSLAGEYFCPVCRLLVYPNEALQSQCTHLYCKPCLTYITSTTRACPYDGYLVTEADSKPLTESNKALSETIGKITVHCLYHRSGCTWQGPLSECTSHCSGCSFGNSPVVCNRCGIQIVHCQVQEHAQNCPVIQTQAHGEGVQNARATETTAAGDHTQVTTQAHPSQTTASPVPGQDPNQQGNPTAQPHLAAQAAVPTAEQWYLQQQQYQQYYQQYPGNDLYQQHYQQFYPYQQQAVPHYSQPQASQPQPQVQLQGQLQTQAQSHSYIQLTATQPQSQPQANSQQQIHSAAQPQSQIQSKTNPPTQGQLRPQAQLHTQTLPVQHHPQHVPMPQYQQPHSQIQHLQTQVHPLHPVALPPAQGLPQTHALPAVQPPPLPYTSQLNQPVNPHLQPQPQNSSAHAVTGHHSFPQPQSQHQMQLGGPQHPALLYPQGGLRPQSQYSVQMQNQLLQQPPPLHPSQSHVPIQNPQQSGLLPSSGQVPSVLPLQQQPVYSSAFQPGVPAHQRPVMQSVQQPIHQQYVQQQQQPFAGQALGSVQNQVHQQGAYAHQPLHVQSQLRPQALTPSFQQPYQAQNLGGRPMMPPHGVPIQPHPHSSFGMQVKPMQVGTGQQSGNPLMINNPALLSSEQHLGANLRPMSDRQSDHIIEKDTEAESTSQKNNKRTSNDVDVTPGIGVDSSEVKTTKSEGYLKPLNDDKKSIDESKDSTRPPGAEYGECLLKKVKEVPRDDTDEKKAISSAGYKQVELSVSEGKEMKDRPPSKIHQLQEGECFADKSMKLKDINLTPQPSLHGQMQGEGLVQPSHLAPTADQGKQQAPLIPHGLSALQPWPVGPGQSHHMQLPRPSGPGHIPLSGQPLRPPAENLQHSPYKQPYGPEVSPAGIAGQGSTSVFGRGQSHSGSQGPYAQGKQTQSYSYESNMFTDQRPNSTDGRRLDPLGQQSGMHSNAVRMNGAPGTDSSPALGLQGDRVRPLPEEHKNPFPGDPARRMFERREFEEDLKLFPRPSLLDNESSRFLSSRPLDRRPHGFGPFGMDKPLDKGQHGLNYDSGMKLETLGGLAPSRFFPPYPHDGIMHPNELGERPHGFHDKIVGRQPDSGLTHHDFFGTVPRYDVAPRSPVRDYPGVPSRGFGAPPGLDDIGGRESRRYGDSFSGSSYPVLHNHLHTGEFEGPGQDGFPSHLRRGEHLGPHSLYGRFGEPIGFDAFCGPARIGELSGPGPGNFFHAQLGEPGFRSRFSLKGFPGDGGIFAGDLESFDNSRRRKPFSIGWCRICKIDCETVEGLDLHSQTSEHQKKSMDMVVTIKQIAKKQKISSSGRSSFDDTSKSRNASFEGRGIKN